MVYNILTGVFIVLAIVGGVLAWRYDHRNSNKKKDKDKIA